MARQRYTAEFKREAVRMLEQGEKPVTQLAAELGIPRSWLYRGRNAIETLGDYAFAGSGRRSPQQQEMARLKREVARLQEENRLIVTR